MKALFLDLDGTLADSLAVMRDVYMRFLGQFGHTGSNEEFDQLNGPPLSEIVRLLKEKYRLPGSVDDLKLNYYEQVDQAYETVVPMMGASELIDAAKQCNMTLAVVTSNRRCLAENWLKHVGFFESFSFLISMEMISYGKPHPDAYLQALEMAKVEPSQAMAVEDSPQGAEAAYRARLRTFAFMHDENIWQGIDVLNYHKVDSLQMVKDVIEHA